MPTRKAAAAKPSALITRDFFVPHVSTVPANAGQLIGLHVRQKIASRTDKAGGARVVLMVHGGSSPAVPVYDLDYKDYSWMNHLAAAGCNVFTMDLTGYGSSPRPLMDNPGNVNPEQQSIVMPRPLAAQRKPDHPYELVTIRHNWDEIGAVVDYLRQNCRVKRLSLVGWSAGCPRVGGYAAQHPDKVDRVVLFAGGKPKPGLKIPERPGPGAPIKLQTRESLEKKRWDPAVRCPDQVEPGIRDVVWKQTMDWDRIGAAWGPAEGVMRIPNRTDFGWTPELAARLTAPTLVMTGEYDHPEDRIAVYEQIGSRYKTFLNIACGSHFIQWEKQHLGLFTASREWLTTGKLCDRRLGKFRLDADGQCHYEGR